MEYSLLKCNPFNFQALTFCLMPCHVPAYCMWYSLADVNNYFVCYSLFKNRPSYKVCGLWWFIYQSPFHKYAYDVTYFSVIQQLTVNFVFDFLHYMFLRITTNFEISTFAILDFSGLHLQHFCFVIFCWLCIALRSRGMFSFNT